MTPPESPIRRRSENFKASDGRPKPPIRKRKKKFATEEDSKKSQDRSSIEVCSNRDSIDSNYVNIGIPNLERERDGEGEVMADDAEIVQEDEHAISVGEEGRDEERKAGEIGTKCPERNREVVKVAERERFVIVEGGEERVLMVTSPEVSLPEQTVTEDTESDRCASNQSVSPDDSLPLSPEALQPTNSTPDISSPVTEIAEQGASSPQLARTGLPGSTPLFLSGKKKPPPLPPPYQSRPPPLPAKQRSMRHNLTDSVLAEKTAPGTEAADPTSIPTAITTAPTPTDPGTDKQLSASNLQNNKSPTRTFSPLNSLKILPSMAERQALSPVPIYEDVESPGASSEGSLTPMNSFEIRVLTSRPDTMPKRSSYGSSDSLELNEGSSLNSKYN